MIETPALLVDELDKFSLVMYTCGREYGFEKPYIIPVSYPTQRDIKLDKKEEKRKDGTQYCIAEKNRGNTWYLRA
jgi:hypothetical protein